MKNLKIVLLLVSILIVSLIMGATVYFYTQITGNILDVFEKKPDSYVQVKSLDSIVEKINKVKDLGGFTSENLEMNSDTTTQSEINYQNTETQIATSTEQ